MKIEKLDIGGFLVETNPFQDDRGVFARYFCKEELSIVLGDREIVNVNFSKTVNRGSIRGLHYQVQPSAEMKLVRAIKGEIFDILVDIRENSPTFLHYHGEILTADNRKMLVIPEGFAHGFQALTDDCEILYLTTQFYSSTNERGLRFNDPMIDIKWPLISADISEKDLSHDLLSSDYKGISLK